jgi:ABC-type multidrug transport system fused ATPase/permease subunit
MVYTIGSLLIPRTITEFINATNKKELFGANVLKTIQSGSMMGILYILGVLIVFFVLLNYIKNVYQTNMLINFSFYSKKMIIKNIFNMLNNNYKELPESEIQWVISQITASCRQITKYIFEYFIPYIIIFLLISIYVFYYSTQIFIVFIIQIILLLITLLFFHNKLLYKWIENDKINLDNNNFIGDKFKNLMNIIFDNSVNNEIKNIHIKEDNLLSDINDSYSLQNKIIFIMNMIIYVSFFIILLIILKQKDLSHIIIVLLLYKSFQTTFINETIFQYYAYSKIIKINSILDNIIINKDCNSIIKFYSIKLNNVSYRYDEKSGYILRNLNIHFKPKEINVLMGKSGSGKTTIMKLIIKMYNPTKGDIYLDETNSKDICQTDIRNNIYYVNQRTILFNETVLYNLQYGNDISKNVILELLNKYDLLDYYKTLEHGLDSTCGVNGSNLSLGMQKIIMVVRGILKPNKPILIFDEPLTSLDKETRVKIVKFIVNETKGKTVIIISHDPEILPYADNIIRL